MCMTSRRSPGSRWPCLTSSAKSRSVLRTDRPLSIDTSDRAGYAPRPSMLVKDPTVSSVNRCSAAAPDSYSTHSMASRLTHRSVMASPPAPAGTVGLLPAGGRAVPAVRAGWGERVAARLASQAGSTRGPPLALAHLLGIDGARRAAPVPIQLAAVLGPQVALILGPAVTLPGTARALPRRIVTGNDVTHGVVFSRHRRGFGDLTEQDVARPDQLLNLRRLARDGFGRLAQPRVGVDGQIRVCPHHPCPERGLDLGVGCGFGVEAEDAQRYPVGWLSPGDTERSPEEVRECRIEQPAHGTPSGAEPGGSIAARARSAFAAISGSWSFPSG